MVGPPLIQEKEDNQHVMDLSMRNAHLIWGAYAPFAQKTQFDLSKNLEKKFTLTSRHSLYACTVLRNIDIFCSMCKKTKKHVSWNAFFQHQICLFYTRQNKSRVAMKSFCAHIAHRGECVTFFPMFFDISKCI